MDRGVTLDPLTRLSCYGGFDVESHLRFFTPQAAGLQSILPLLFIRRSNGNPALDWPESVETASGFDSVG